MPRSWHLRRARDVLAGGGVIAYPTEAIYGLGCDPLNGVAAERLLELKRRPWQKGLILIGADFAQLEPYLLPLTDVLRKQVMATWPGPVTWVLPARSEVPYWLRGEHDSLAVRVSAHPLAADLCRVWGGALVSTSANLAEQRPARNPLGVRRAFGDSLDYILHGPLGGQSRPSEIRDGRSGAILRAG